MITDTSEQSLREVMKSKQGLSDQECIYQALMRLGEATDRELTRYLDLEDPDIVRPRRKELVDRGDVVQSCKRNCKVTGKWVIAWKVNTGMVSSSTANFQGLTHPEFTNLKRGLYKKLEKANQFQRREIKNLVNKLA